MESDVLPPVAEIAWNLISFSPRTLNPLAVKPVSDGSPSLRLQLLQDEQLKSGRSKLKNSVPTGPETLPLVSMVRDISSPQENLSSVQTPGSAVMDPSSGGGGGGGGATAVTVSNTEREVLPLPLVVLVKTTVSE